MAQRTGDGRTYLGQAATRWLAAFGALLLFGAGCGGPEVEDEDIIVREPVVTGVPYGGGPTDDMANLEDAVARPAVYNGDTVYGQGTVAEVVSERGFWLESEGQFIFTVIREREYEQVALKAGHILQLSGELHETDDLSALEGELDPYAARVLERQEFYLVVSANTLQIVTRGVAQRTSSN
ncbi:hypothetical protein FIV42_05430 [Persicimonas caeni]|uniref:Uncharacterized protein n=1 Tax=Persicimonas caeni TaxID=2292766 RepID=A0A4Y6PPJ6_PERCE|nr:hypothetical protein [Persicimonas caeni]QDG50190.1 hypothetical protein FIV42_05430 [Persicimonas caeni]QED31411.1 hypothetical protein FRD00_05425 [Persicimonas caeni]